MTEPRVVGQAPVEGDGNVTQGDVVAVDTHDSLLRTDGKAVVAALGLDKIAVIAVGDAVFVAPMARVSEVKDLIPHLGQQRPDCVALPARVTWPWGCSETVASGPRFQVAHILVDPGETLPLQMDDHRSGHWVVVHGSAEVTVGERVSILGENESIYIPAGTSHRLGNPGKHPLELVEIRCGAEPGEDDIVPVGDL